MRTIQFMLFSLALIPLPTLPDSQRPDYGPPIKLSEARVVMKAAEDVASAQAQLTLTEGQAGLRYLQLNGMTAVEGGLPLLRSNQLISAIGVSGVTSQQDGVIALAGAEVLR